jgi:hypothetical protein
MEGTGFYVMIPYEPEIKDEEPPLPTPLKETMKRNERSEECVLPNESELWSSSTSSLRDHSGSVAACDTHFGQSWGDSRSRHTSRSEDAGLFQGYVIISTDELLTEGGTDPLYTSDDQTKKKTCRFNEKRFSLTKSAKLSKLHKGAGMKKHHTAPTPDQRRSSHELRTKETSSVRSRTEGCATEVVRVPPVEQEN